jgi:hypothetical protein
MRLSSPSGSLALTSYGAIGVLGILGQAIWRLTPIALEPLGSLNAGQLALLMSWIAISIYAEGYRAFQLRFCPRVVARALYVGRLHPEYTTASPPRIAALLAPLFCMGFFYARTRTLITAWVVSAMIVTLVVIVRGLPQPWRGIIDAGVVVGLSYGVVALLFQLITALRGTRPPALAELPGE